MDIAIYTTPSCPFCHQAKEFLTERKVPYVEYNVADDEVRREEMIEKSGQYGVPVIEIGGEIIVGFDKIRLEEALDQPRLKF